MKNDEITGFPLSDDPEENLRMENELLRLQMKAELGAESHTVSDIDPEIENAFLKNVMAFQRNFATTKPTKIFDLAGRPAFKKCDELNDERLENALQEVTDLLSAHNIEVYFGEGYDNRTQYRFITEELFEHETSFLPVPGMVTHFDYEEFHPNHKKDIEHQALGFITGWFERSLDERSWELAHHFILPDRKIMSREEIAAQLKNIFEAYPKFTGEHYVIQEVGFQLQDDGGLGHAEGMIKYNAVLEDGATIAFNGPFKLYMSYEGGYWSIFHIVFPGFKYFY